MKIFWTLFFLQENSQKTVNFGFNTWAQLQQQESMSLIFKKLLKTNFKKNKLEKQVSALNEKNFMHSALMNWLDKSQLIVLREDSC